MNHSYRLVWNDALGLWTVAHERARGRGKSRNRTVLAAAAALLLAHGASQAAGPAAGSLPQGAQVIAGQAVLQSGGSAAAPLLTVQQASQRLVTNWQSFDIGTAAAVRFVQPTAGSVALNRVLAGDASQILGRLEANGQIFLLNPAGVVFGRGARVDVGGLVASSLAMSDTDFLAGRYNLARAGSAGAVTNQGEIQGRSVVLAAPQVANEGRILTPGGSTALAAADAMTLGLGDSGLISLTLDRAAVAALVRNGGVIEADGGQVLLSARATGDALATVVNNEGMVRATRLQTAGGRIVLDGGDSGTVQVGGTLDARSADGQGGDVTVTGRQIALGSTATLDASGATGGGRIRVGGGWQGQDASVANAQAVDVAAGAQLRADAGQRGAGGQVVVWSDDTTQFAGKVSVRGGEAGGDGGRIEVSGKQSLVYSGRADARAPRGRTGDLLLDPITLEISGGGTGSDSVTGSVVYEKDIEAQNANVLLQATGDILVNDLNLNGGDGRITMQPNVSLRIEAGTANGGHLTPPAGLTVSSAASFTDLMFANAANTLEVSGTGSLMLVAGATRSGRLLNVPNLSASGAGSNPGSLPAHTVTSPGSGTPSAGSITLYGADGAEIGGSLTTNGGYVRIWADSDNGGAGYLTLTSPITTQGGNLHLSTGSGNVTLNSDMTLGAGRLFFRTDGSYTNGTKILGGVLSASGDVNVSTAFQMNAGASILTDGVIRLSSTVNLNTGAGALTLRGSAIDFTGATLQNLSTASLKLEPADPATNMVLGDASGFASASTLAALPGIRNLTIGRADGTGTVSVPGGNFSFNASGNLEVVNRSIDITGGTLANTNGNVVLTGDTINISRSITANGGTGAVTIRQQTPANAITLGSGLTNSAVGHINAATLIIGRSDGGTLSFDADISTTATTVHLLSGQQVLGINGGVSAANVAVTAGGGATLSSPTFDFSTLALEVGGTTQISKTAGDLTLGTVNGISGLNITTGSHAAVTVQAPGAITVSGNLALAGNSSTVTMRGSSVALSGASASGLGSASLKLEPVSAADDLSVGGAGGFVSGASLATLDGAANVTVGRADGSGTTTVTGPVSRSVSGTLALVNGTITLSGGSLANTGGALALTANTGGLTLGQAASAASQLTLAAASGSTVAASGDVSAASLLLDGAGAAFQLDGSANAVGTLAGNVGSVRLSQAGALTVGAVGAVDGLTASGGVTLRTTGATSDLTLDRPVQGGDLVVLGAGRNFVNNAGAAAVTSVNDRWNVYSGSPLDDTRGGLAADYKQYNTAFGVVGSGTGNGFLYRVAPTVSVTLVGSASKTYDATTDLALTAGNLSLSGAIDGDTVSTNAGATPIGALADKLVGAGKVVTLGGLALTGASNGAIPVYGYQLAATSATGAIATVDPATLGLGSITAASKVYDRSTSASANAALTGRSGAMLGDDVRAIVGAASFADPNVGAGKSVTASGITLVGADAGNYQLASTSGTGTGAITPATLVLTAATVASKVYDGNATAAVSGSAVSGVLGPDVVTVAGSGRFADKNVGGAKPVNLATLTLAGADAGNYQLDVSGISRTADITPKALTVGAATVASKVYDGTTAATVSAVALGGVVDGDTVGTSASGAFADKNAGTGKAVAVSGITLGGADAGNYTLASHQASGTADIAPKALTVGAATVASKVYDGTTAATVSAVALGGVVDGDTVGTSASGAFADKNAGTGKAVAVSGITLGGADAGNYTLASHQASGTADIAPRPLAIVAQGVDKVYDGRVEVDVRLSDNRVSGDVLELSRGAATLADKHAGRDKPVTVAGLGVTGADAGNYVLVTTAASTTASVDPALLLLSMSADKVYDGGTAALVRFGDNRVAGDQLAVSAAQAGFADRNAGADKPVTASGLALSGADAGNYRLASTMLTGSASIAKADLSVRANDAQTVASGVPFSGGAGVGISGLQGGDAADVLGGTPVYGGSAQGARLPGGYTISVSGLSAQNYTPRFTDGQLVIAPAADTSNLVRSLSSGGQGGNGTADSAGQGATAPAAGMAGGAMPAGSGAASVNAAGMRSLVTDRSAAPLTGGAAGAGGAGGAGEAATIPVYRTDGGVVVPETAVRVQSATDGLFVTAIGTAVPPLANFTTGGSRAGVVQVTLPGGAVADLRLSLSAEGVLLVRLPETLAQSPQPWLLTALFNGTAGQLGWSQEQIKAVLLR